MKKCFSNISYCGKDVHIFDAVTEEQIVDANEFIKNKIDETFNPEKNTWPDLYAKNKKLITFISLHSRRERYHMEMFKCVRESCHFCKPVRMPEEVWKNLCLSPNFLLLPEPVESKFKEENSLSILYESYSELKFKRTTDKYRSGWDPFVNKNSLKA